ncbi:MAG: hypothetical protein JRH10_06160 [Deltaproteobacteria bacterium]|nr:hypothetical protein [Deltaproteobacteria bacterium]MBW2444868.1 hypothetical protein [Deltaproteobacteria bacterium]
MEIQAKPGPGRFQWSTGGWFGAQLGATLWLLLLGGLMLGQGRSSGGVVLALGLLVNGLGVYLWSARGTREPYPAIQLFLGACSVVALASVLLASASNPSTGASSAPSLPTLLVYPALMGVFHLQETASRKSSN